MRLARLRKTEFYYDFVDTYVDRNHLENDIIMWTGIKSQKVP